MMFLRRLLDMRAIWVESYYLNHSKGKKLFLNSFIKCIFKFKSIFNLYILYYNSVYYNNCNISNIYIFLYTFYGKFFIIKFKFWKFIFSYRKWIKSYKYMKSNARWLKFLLW